MSNSKKITRKEFSNSIPIVFIISNDKSLKRLPIYLKEELSYSNILSSYARSGELSLRAFLSAQTALLQNKYI